MLIQQTDKFQTMMFTCFDELISSDNPVRLVDLVVDTLLRTAKKPFDYKGQSHEGRPAFPLSIMLKLYIYCYSIRIKSSRAMETETHRNIELKWLIGDLKPDFRTIANFRTSYKHIIKKFSKEFRLMLKSMKLIGSEFAIDGTKIKANANKDMHSKNKILLRLKEIDNLISCYLTDLETNDKKEDKEPENELPEESINNDTFASSETPSDKPSIQSKIEKLNSEIFFLENKLAEMKDLDKNYLSDTEPDCNLMKSRDGYIPGFNAQIAVDTTSKFIVCDLTTDRCNDIDQSIPVVNATLAELEISNLTAIKDSGYFNLNAIEQLEKNGQARCYTSLTYEDPNKKNFKYDKERDCYTCSEGKILVRERIKETNGAVQTIRYKCKDCQECPKREACTKSKTGKTIDRFSNQEYRDEYRKRMKTDEAKSKLRKRKSTVECMFGTIKIMAGKIPILTRGIKNVETEFKLYCLTYNVKHLFGMFTFAKVAEMVKAYAEGYVLFSLKAMNYLFFSKNKLKFQIYFERSIVCMFISCQCYSAT